MDRSSRGVSRTIGAVAIIIVLAIAAGVVFVSTQRSPSPGTSTSTVTSTVTSSSSSVITSTVPTTVTTTVTTSSSTSSLPSVITVDEASAPSSNDPGAVIDNNGIELAQNTVLPLIFFNYSDNSHYVPVLASSWNGSADGLTYTFHLRTDVYFSNGDQFNAYVVWYNVYRDMLINQPIDFVMYQYFNTSGVTVDDVNALNSPQNTPDAKLLQVVQNPHNAVTVPDPYTVQFHLVYPFAAFLTTLPDSPWYFIDPYIVEQHGGVVANQPNTWMSVNGTSVADGPYVTQQYVPNQFSVLVANPHYWAQSITGSRYLQPAKIPQVIINYKTDELTRILDLTTGRAEASIIGFNDVNSTLNLNKHIYVPNTGISGTVEDLLLNTEKPPLNNLLLRRAIVAAVNVSEIRAAAYNGLIVPFVGPDLRTFPYYNDSINAPAYDPALAKQLLVQAGYPDGKGLPPITFAYPVSSYQAAIAQILVQQLNQVGITLQPLAYNFVTFITSVQSINGSSDQAPNIVSLSGWTFQPDVTGYWPLIDDQQGVFHMLNNQTIHNLIIKSNSELNPQKRAAEISQVTEMVLQQAGVIWIGQDLDFYDSGSSQGPILWNSCVTGMWYNTAFNGVPFNSLNFSCIPST